jgi:hypothetical protein
MRVAAGVSGGLCGKNQGALSNDLGPATLFEQPEFRRNVSDADCSLA